MNEKQLKLLDYYKNLIDRLKTIEKVQAELDSVSVIFNEETTKYLQDRIDRLRFSLELEKIAVQTRLSKL